jgi:hypothetical protein
VPHRWPPAGADRLAGARRQAKGVLADGDNPGKLRGALRGLIHGKGPPTRPTQPSGSLRRITQPPPTKTAMMVG